MAGQAWGEVLMIVKTQSGTEYEFTDDMTQVRRRGGLDMRADGEWLALHNAPNPQVGEAMVLVLDGLSLEASVTYRHTSPVKAVLSG